MPLTMFSARGAVIVICCVLATIVNVLVFGLLGVGLVGERDAIGPRPHAHARARDVLHLDEERLYGERAGARGERAAQEEREETVQRRLR